MSRTKDFYSKLITSQYQNAANILSFLDIFLSKLKDCSDFLEGIDAAFDLDTAVGAQLDILGEIAGISRRLNFQPNYGLSPILRDSDFRTLIRATIGKNQWDGEQDSLYTLWAVLFPGAAIAIHDNHWMDMDVFVQFPDLTSIFIDLIKRGYIVPKPEGVKQRIYIGPPFPLFGFDYDDPYVTGFDRGYWWNPDRQYPAFGFDLDDIYISGCDRGSWWPDDIGSPSYLIDEAKRQLVVDKATGQALVKK